MTFVAPQFESDIEYSLFSGASEPPFKLAPAPIDCNALLEQCLGNVDFALSMLDRFEKSSDQRLDAFAAAWAERNHQAISFQAHALKGVAGILAASELAQVCADLEATPAHGHDDLARTGRQIEQLREEIQRVVEFIPTVRQLARKRPATHPF